MTARTDPAADLQRWLHESDDPRLALLRLTLMLGVPLRIAQYQHDRRSVAWLTDHARWAGRIIAHHGDALLYRTAAHTSGGRRHPSTAEVCNALVEGVACAALVAEGGITVFGLHFDIPGPTEAAGG
jgi:hypothetical protein